MRLELLGAQPLDAALVGRFHDRLGERMLALSLDGGDEAEQLAVVEAVAAAVAATSGSPRVRVPVLSSTTVSSEADCSIAIAFLKRISRRAPSFGADRADRGRRGEPERVRAGDHDDGDREQQRVPRVAVDPVPDEEGAETADQRDEHEPERGSVGESLCGNLRVLRLLDELDDLRERGIQADRARSRPAARPCLLIVAPISLSPGFLLAAATRR